MKAYLDLMLKLGIDPNWLTTPVYFDLAMIGGDNPAKSPDGCTVVLPIRPFIVLESDPDENEVIYFLPELRDEMKIMDAVLAAPPLILNSGGRLARNADFGWDMYAYCVNENDVAKKAAGDESAGSHPLEIQTDFSVTLEYLETDRFKKEPAFPEYRYLPWKSTYLPDALPEALKPTEGMYYATEWVHADVPENLQESHQAMMNEYMNDWKGGEVEPDCDCFMEFAMFMRLASMGHERIMRQFFFGSDGMIGMNVVEGFPEANRVFYRICATRYLKEKFDIRMRYDFFRQVGSVFKWMNDSTEIVTAEMHDSPKARAVHEMFEPVTVRDVQTFMPECEK